MNTNTDGNLAALRQHQREIDRIGDLEDAAETREQDCREALMRMERFEFPQKVPGQIWNRNTYVDADDVLDAMHDLGASDIARALAMLDDDPLEAAKILKAVRNKAVEDVLGRMDFEEIVILEAEQRGEAA